MTWLFFLFSLIWLFLVVTYCFADGFGLLRFVAMAKRVPSNSRRTKMPVWNIPDACLTYSSERTFEGGQKQLWWLTTTTRTTNVFVMCWVAPRCVSPKGGRGCLMSPLCLDPQGCNLIPFYYLLSCNSCLLQLLFVSCLFFFFSLFFCFFVFVFFVAYSPILLTPENSSVFFV